MYTSADDDEKQNAFAREAGGDDDYDGDGSDDVQVSTLDEAKEQIRQMREVIRSLGGLEPVKASSEKVAAVDNDKHAISYSASIVMDTAKFGARLFVAVQKKQTIRLAIDRDCQVVSFEAV